MSHHLIIRWKKKKEKKRERERRRGREREREERNIRGIVSRRAEGVIKVSL